MATEAFPFSVLGNSLAAVNKPCVVMPVNAALIGYNALNPSVPYCRDVRGGEGERWFQEGPLRTYKPFRSMGNSLTCSQQTLCYSSYQFSFDRIQPFKYDIELKNIFEN